LELLSSHVQYSVFLPEKELWVAKLRRTAHETGLQNEEYIACKIKLIRNLYGKELEKTNKTNVTGAAVQSRSILCFSTENPRLHNGVSWFL
jgi:hypothetical protein